MKTNIRVNLKRFYKKININYLYDYVLYVLIVEENGTRQTKMATSISMTVLITAGAITLATRKYLYLVLC